MKKRFNWHSQLSMKYYALTLSTFLMLSGLCMSCSDDDDDLTEEERRELEANHALDPYEKHGEQAMALLQVVSQLTDADSLPDNWRDAIFEPTRGSVADASQPHVRWQTVSSADEARRIFQSLSGQTIADGTATMTWQADGVGSMTYTATNQADCYATVDVSIRQIPHLTQLRLVPTSALGDNALSKKPYYRIGDMVQDQQGRYWVCVRSAGHDVASHADKKTTHWVTLQLLSSNQKIYAPSSNRYAHIVPTDLGGSRTDLLTYFAQLMWVLQKPNDYKLGVRKGYIMEDGLGSLGADRNQDPYAYEWGDVEAMATTWNRLKLWSKLLPMSIKKDSLLRGDSLCIFYNGYSSPIFSSNMTLYYVKQSGATLSNQEVRTLQWDMNKKVGFNIMDYALGGAATAASTAPGIPKNAIVVCQGTGKTLGNTYFEPDYDKPIEGVKPIYVANIGGISSYYHLGDIVKDRDNRHWFCIMPYDDSDAPESHWITMQMLDEDSPKTGFLSNYQTIEAKPGVHGRYVMPANLGIYNNIYVSYFAQMLYLYNNSAYEMTDYKNEPYYPAGLYGYGRDFYDSEWAMNMYHFFHYGHAWNIVKPGNVSPDFTSSSDYFFIIGGLTTDDEMAELNYIRAYATKRILYEVKSNQWNMTGGDNMKFDVRDYEQTGHPNTENTTIPDILKSGIMICHATGSELAGGTVLDTHDITQPIDGLEEVRTMNKPYVVPKK